MSKKTILGACAALSLSLMAGAAVAATAPTPFAEDVNTAINRGLAHLESDGAYDSYASGCSGYAYNTINLMRGLSLLALLEKRASGNLNDEPQGYSGASDADKTRMRNAVACILDSANEISEEAYYYGNWLMALSLYARTGGPDKGADGIPNDPDLMGLTDAINKLTDDLIDAQCPASYATVSYRGMWSYSGCGDDSSTSQFATAGLAGARAYYASMGDPGGRVAKIGASLNLAAKHYADNGSMAGSDNGSCDRIEETEKGHGYHTSYNPSLQQTASGLWVQLLGGYGVNDAGVQAYLRWIRNHYRWQDLDSMGNSWPYYSYYYYLWSSMKGVLTIAEFGVGPAAGNLGANAYGELGPDVDPNTSDSLAGTCAVRQVHKDPATVGRPAAFGAGGADYYALEQKSTYFDYAHTLLSYQCENGDFACNGAPDSWESGPDRVAWGLLVLQRSTGGACADLDKDGKCDQTAPPQSGGQCDVNFDGRVNYADVMAMLPFAKARLRLGGANAAVPGLAAADATTFAQVNSEDAWFGTGGDNEVNIADFTRCIFRANGR